MIGNDTVACDTIRSAIQQFCSDVEFRCLSSEAGEALTTNTPVPDLIFWDAAGNLASRHVEADTFPSGSLNVLLIDETLPARAVGAGANWASVHNCLRKPLQVADLLITLSNGRSLVELRRALLQQQVLLHNIMARQINPGIVGIPTEDGMEFLPAQEILRCEGLNKYTKIVTNRQGSIISSYNIGEFAKMLQTFGFFACHKSHLINLRCIKRLTIENQIILHDGSCVPLSRRRRLEFVQRFRGDGGCGMAAD